jgi:predicted nucleic acid-binding protein
VTFVVDASVAVKWLVEERDSNAAKRLLELEEKLVAPDFVLVKVGNVMWKKVRRSEIEVEQSIAGVQTLPGYFDELAPSASLLIRALAIAVELDHPVYDCLYLACAESVDATLVTADDHFAAKALTHTASWRITPHTQVGLSRD